MILVYILIFALSCVSAVLAVNQRKLVMRICSAEGVAEERNKQLANAAMHISDNQKEIEKLREELEEFKLADQRQDKKLEEVLEKKWEDAIQVISNFDPFSKGEKE